MRAAMLFGLGLAMAGGAAAQALPQVTVSATRSEAAPFDRTWALTPSEAGRAWASA